MSLGMEFNWTFLILHDIIVEKMYFSFQEKYLSFILSMIRQERKWGVSDSLLDVRKRGGGGPSDAYCVQQGGWGGLKNGKKCVCN